MRENKQKGVRADFTTSKTHCLEKRRAPVCQTKIMATSSDDDMPLTRLAPAAAPAAATAAPAAPRAPTARVLLSSDGSDGVSPVPDWIKSATLTKVRREEEREMEEKGARRSPRLFHQMLNQPSPHPQPPKPPPSDSDDSSDGRPLALKAESLRRSGGGGAAAAARAGAGTPAVTSPAGSKQKTAASKRTPAKANGSTAKPSTKPGAAVLQLGAAPALAAPAGELPLVLPDRLPPSKLIVELEDGGTGGRTDLTGDAGVVGRVLVDSSADGGGAVRLDLKGTLYASTLVPCIGTLVVVNVTGDAARVEAVARSYCVLTPESGGGDDDGRGDLFAGDDDDDGGYEPVAVTQAAAADGGGGGVAKRGAKRGPRAAPGKGRGRGRGKKAKR